MQSIRKQVYGRLLQILMVMKENQSLSLLIVINLLLRIPRVPGVIGDDVFVVLWMGRIAQEGDFANWTLTPLSIFGMYPFSGYPIGIPLLFGFAFWLGLSIESAILVFSMTFCVIGLLGAYSLGKEIFSDAQAILLFATAYSLSHLFLRFTYSTLPARGPFLAILPWFLWASVKFARKKKLKDGLVSGGLLFTLFLIHGLALFTFILYLGVFLGYLCIIVIERLLMTRVGGIQQRFSVFASSHVTISAIIARASSKKLKRFILWSTLLAAILAAYLIGLTILSIDPRKTAPILMPNDTILGMSINLIVDYGLRLGVLSWFFPLGIVASFHNDYNTNRWRLHFVLIPMVAFTIPLSKYASVVFLPVMIYYSVYGASIAWKEKTRKPVLFSLLAFTVSYSALYHLYVVYLPPFALGFAILVGLVLVGLSVLEITARLSRTTHMLSANNGWRILVLVIICFSIVTTDGLTQSSDTSYITEDEKTVIAFLSSLSETGVVFVNNPLVARRLQAYSIPAIRAFNEPIGLNLGWITPDQIIENTYIEFSLGSFLLNGDIFSYEGLYPEAILWSSLYGLDLTNSTCYSEAIEYNLDFVLVEKEGSEYSNRYAEQYCALLHSAPLACELVLETESLALFRL